MDISNNEPKQRSGLSTADIVLKILRKITYTIPTDRTYFALPLWVYLLLWGIGLQSLMTKSLWLLLPMVTILWGFAICWAYIILGHNKMYQEYVISQVGWDIIISNIACGIITVAVFGIILILEVGISGGIDVKHSSVFAEIIIGSCMLYTAINAGYKKDFKSITKKANKIESLENLIERSGANNSHEAFTFSISRKSFHAVLIAVTITLAVYIIYDKFIKKAQPTNIPTVITPNNIYNEERQRAEARGQILYEECVNRCDKRWSVGRSFRSYCEDQCRRNVLYEER